MFLVPKKSYIKSTHVYIYIYIYVYLFVHSFSKKGTSLATAKATLSFRLATSPTSENPLRLVKKASMHLPKQQKNDGLTTFYDLFGLVFCDRLKG